MAFQNTTRVAADFVVCFYFEERMAARFGFQWRTLRNHDLPLKKWCVCDVEVVLEII